MLYLSSDLFHHERQECQPPLPAHGERSWGYRQADSEGRPVWVQSADWGVWGVQWIISTVRAHSVLNNVDQIWISTATRGVQDVSTVSSVPVEIVSKWWWVDQMVFTSKWSLWIIISSVLGEAGLHKWMPFVIFHARSHKRSLAGWFLSRHCFMLCITMEIEPRIVMQYKCHHCCSWKLLGKGDGGWKKVSLHCFLADQKVAVLFWGIL